MYGGKYDLYIGGAAWAALEHRYDCRLRNGRAGGIAHGVRPKLGLGHSYSYGYRLASGTWAKAKPGHSYRLASGTWGKAKAGAQLQVSI